MMNTLIKVIAIGAALVSFNLAAQNSSSIGASVGYNNNYVVNGVVRAKPAPFFNFDATKSLKYADLYIGGILLPNNNLDQSHWTAGVGNKFDLFGDFALRSDATVTRHQSGIAGIPNSTEVGLKVALQNPYATPYVRGSYDYNLDQTGVAAGIYREQVLPYGFYITPLAEYGRYTDYETLTVKASLTRPFTTPVGVITPFAEVAWLDNDFSVGKYNFALKEASGTVLYAAGISLKF